MKIAFSEPGSVETDIFAQWVANRIDGAGDGFGPCATMRVYGNTLRAAVVFHNWSPDSGVMEMSAAAESPRWLNRRVLWAMHDYIFNRAGGQMAVLRVAENNTTMRRIAKAYGYTEMLIPRLRGRNEAEAILMLTDDEWARSRFHKDMTDGKEKPAGPA